jgi:hypothetical protein
LSLPGSQVSGNISGNASNVTGIVDIANGGTGQTNPSDAFNALLPSQTGNNGKYLSTDGTNTSWAASGGSPGGSSTQVQFNNSGAFAGSSAITLTTTTATASALRIDPRVSSVTTATAVAPDIRSFDVYAFKQLSSDLSINAPSTTSPAPVDGDKLIFRFLDNGTPRNLTWDSIYTAFGITLPATTTANKTTYVGCIYNAYGSSGTGRWDVIAVTTQL